MIALLRALSLSLLCLFTSVAFASAECAWVLWSQLEAVNSPLRLTPVGGFPSFAQCTAQESEASKMSDTEKQTMRDLGVKSLTYTCLPDTVDPRGPKGQ